MTTITRERLEQIYAECEERDPAIFEVRELVRIALASLEAVPPAPVIPDGYVMVPREPTKSMRMAIHPLTEATCMNCGCKVVAECADIILMAWDDMLSAAPQPEGANGE